MTVTERDLHRQWYCLHCQQLKAVDDFELDPKDTSGHKRVCKDCEAGRPVVRASKESSTLRIDCRHCKRMLPLESFYKAAGNQAKLRYHRRWLCIECERAATKEREKRKRLDAADLKLTGTRIHVGTGVIVQNNHRAVTSAVDIVKRILEDENIPTSPPVPIPLPEPPAPAYATMSINDWLDLDTVPSAFQIDSLLLVLSREDSGLYIDILSVTGEGPGQRVNLKMAEYIVGLLAKKGGADQGVMYY